MPALILSGTFVINDRKEVLLLHRPEKGHYEKPGGKLEETDAVDWRNPTIPELLERAMRELHEEIGGVIATDFRYLGKVDSYTKEGKTTLAHAFTARYVSGPIIPTEDRFDHARFMPLSEVAKYEMSPDFKEFLPLLAAYLGRP